jgi:O-antigen/teichoic acid export membrane protein
MIATLSTAAMMTRGASATLRAVAPETHPAAAETAASADDLHLRSADAGNVAATGGTVRLQTRFVGLLLSLGSTIVIVRYLTEAQFGELALIVALVTIVSGLSDLGLAGVGIREWIRHGVAERKLLLADLLGLRLVAICGASLLAIAFAIAVGYGRTVVVGMTFALVGTTFLALQGALTIPLVAELRQGLVGVLELLTVAVQAVLQVVLVLKQLLRESAAFAAAGAVSVVYLRVAVLIGPAFLTPSEFGAFSVAFRAVEPLTMLPSILTGALFPLLTHAALHDRMRLARGYDMLWRSTATLGALGAACVVGVAPLITLVFTGGRNPITVDAFVLLGCALGALVVGAAGMWALLAERRYRAVLAINVVALSCNVALTVAAGAWLGPRWFALGILCSEAIIAVAADSVCRRGLRRSGHPTPGEPLAHAAKVVLAVLTALAAFGATRDLFPLVPLVACSGVAAATLLLTRAVPHELSAMVREVASRLVRRGPRAGVTG